ncbi:MAG: neutral zinc metallopeptidase, partial [Burkholderiales bacterium]
MSPVDGRPQRSAEKRRDRGDLISVRAYLQARRILERGDIEEAMNAAAQIGDGAQQRRQQGYVVSDSCTHGTSAQRQTWV